MTRNSCCVYDVERIVNGQGTCTGEVTRLT